MRMGVKDLWTILAPTSERKSLFELEGKSIAVDLSCWVVEDQSLGTCTTQPRMYLRNLFFRTSCLLMLGVKPIFVLEGEAPTLKHATMSKRNEVQFKAFQQISQALPCSQPSQSQPNVKKGSRSRLKSILKQCAEMLSLMGATCVQSSGEAEALCAQLNALNMVDGCITQDGDCFLYGAQTVYRNFTIAAQGASNSSGFSVDVYTMSNIEEKLNLDREKLVALSLLCGCDYGQGVSGVGKSLAKAFLDSLGNDHNVLDRLKRWRTDSYFKHLEKERVVLTMSSLCDNCTHSGKQSKHDISGCKECGCYRGCTDNIKHRVLTTLNIEDRKILMAELNLRKKALQDLDFPSKDMIDEFLLPRPRPESMNITWKEPNIALFIKFAVKLLSWTETYAFEKFLPLVTRWQTSHLYTNKENIHKEFDISPVAIVKKRIQKGVPCYELKWFDKKSLLSSLTLDEGVSEEDLLLSVEPQILVQVAYPQLVEGFVAAKEAKIKGKKGPKKKAIKSTSDTLKQKTLAQLFIQPDADDSFIQPPVVRRKKALINKEKQSKKPVVTIASLKQKLGRIEVSSSQSQANTRRSELAGKRLGSPSLKVGLKTKLKKLNSTPKKSLLRESLNFNLEESFMNISLLADSDIDDCDFSDLSIIINEIIGGNENVMKSVDVPLMKSNIIDGKSDTVHSIDVLGAADNRLGECSDEESDEFDYCNREIVPLCVRLKASNAFL